MNTNYGKSFVGESIKDVFLQVRKSMLNDANKVDSRVSKTVELLTPVITITNPRKRLMYCRERKFNLVYALVEACMLFQPNNEVKYFSKFNKNMLNYSDDGKYINSAYGQYISKYIPELVNKLKNNNETRQAVLNIYTSEFGIIKETKDVPCTLNLHFIIRNNKLNLVVHMRSNDLFWGFQYDVFMFTFLQEVVANTLGIDVGIYQHVASSLHVYDYHWEMLANMSEDKVEDVEESKINYTLDNVIEASDSLKNIVNNKISEVNGDLISKVFLNEDTHRAQLHFGLPYAIEEFPNWVKKFKNKWFISLDG